LIKHNVLYDSKPKKICRIFYFLVWTKLHDHQITILLQIFKSLSIVMVFILGYLCSVKEIKQIRRKL